MAIYPEFTGADDPDQAKKALLGFLFNEYPGMESAYELIKQARVTNLRWVEAAYEAQEKPTSAKFESMVETDQDLIPKFQFMCAAAIVDNPSIDPDLKPQLIQIIFPGNSA